MKKNLLLTLLLLGLASYLTYQASKPASVNKVTPVQSVKKEKAPKPSLPKLDLVVTSPGLLDNTTIEIISTSLDSPLSYSQKSKEIEKLRNKDLQKDDFLALYNFLKTKPSLAGAQLALHSLKNDILVFVINDGRYKELTALLMLDIINDPYQHEVMREYTLQYTTDYFQRHWLDTKAGRPMEKSSLSLIDKELQTSFLTTMWNMVGENNGSIAGTSLTRLNDLSENFSIVDSQRIIEESAYIVKDLQAPVSLRMSALSIATKRKLKHLKKDIHEIVLNEENAISLRMAALHTASTMNDQDGFIENITHNFIDNDNVDSRLQVASKMILKQLNKNDRDKTK